MNLTDKAACESEGTTGATSSSAQKLATARNPLFVLQTPHETSFAIFGASSHPDRQHTHQPGLHHN